MESSRTIHEKVTKQEGSLSTGPSSPLSYAQEKVNQSKAQEETFVLSDSSKEAIVNNYLSGQVKKFNFKIEL